MGSQFIRKVLLFGKASVMRRAGAGSGAEPRAPAREERGRSRRRRRRAARGDPPGQARRKHQGEPGAERGPRRPTGAGRTGGGGARPATAGASGGRRGPERRARDRADRPRPTEAGAPAGEARHGPTGPGRGPKPGGGTARLWAGPPEGRTRARTPQKPRAQPRTGRARGKRRGARRTATRRAGGRAPTANRLPARRAEKEGHGVAPSSLGIVLILIRHNSHSRWARIRQKSHRYNSHGKGVDKTASVWYPVSANQQKTKIPGASCINKEGHQTTKDGYCTMNYNTRYQEAQVLVSGDGEITTLEDRRYAWKERRERNMKLYELYEKAGYPEYAARTRDCATFLEFATPEGGEIGRASCRERV